MTDSLSPAAADQGIVEPARKRQKRSYVACLHCHSQKVKCSGNFPCERCQSANKGASCKYPARDRKVTVSESYLKQLQEKGRGSTDSVVNRETIHHSPPQPSAVPLREDLPPEDREIINPLQEPRDIYHLDQASRQQFSGESTCLAYCDRFLQCLRPQSTASMSAERQYATNVEFARQVQSTANCKLPDHICATLLVRVALRFIGHDYHLFMHHEFLQQLEKAYSSKDNPEYDALWACKFFVVLALGELYSTASTPPTGQGSGLQVVPGTGYFLTAVSLLQDLFEEPSTAQIEIMLLFPTNGSVLTPVEREHRARLWWTVYIFDRSTTSRLGLPLSIHDTDIDVEMPSSDTLSPEVLEILGPPAHLIANIGLSRITGSIVQNIYSRLSIASPSGLVNNIRAILKDLRKWDANLPSRLRMSGGASYRSTASLQLHFNQCIILTTRPILLHILTVKNPFSNVDQTVDDPDTPVLSDTTKMLADSCIVAARTSSSILSQLFVDNALATYGYFDAHHLFSSALVLIISAILSPNSSDSDAVQTAFHLLRIMRHKGNTIALQYYSRLTYIQWTIGRLRASAAAATEQATASNNDILTTHVSFSGPGSQDAAEFDDYNCSNSLLSTANFTSLDSINMEGISMGNLAVDPLGDPLLQTFLGDADASWDRNLRF
ncbi:hypothetical protein V502_10537 [Pseudogymnoascus sp. VKM F-4520 (FW-2644)]|nr:hypothetical protein V502_10537 [Pseudogymnoascus sp. VKM F-4520 (FW-2644)]